MSLVYTNPVPAGTPGLHVFIAGVSAYRHLPGYVPAPGQPQPPLAADSFGISQLSSASLTGRELALWLMGSPVGLSCTVANMRVLLSAQNGQPTMNDIHGQPVDRCSRAAFIGEAINWRNDVVQHPDGIALFYFAGHGVQRSPRDTVLLMDDFNDPLSGGPLNNAVNVGNLYNGLSVHASRPNVARSQFFFIDACRVMPLQLAQYQAMDAPPIWPIELAATDQRAAPLFYAAQSGTSAAARPGVSTLFGEALMGCLDKNAAILDDSSGQAKWTISSSSLKAALSKSLDMLNKRYGGDQVVVVDGMSGDPVLRTLPGPPLVEQLFALEPDAASGCTTVSLLSPPGPGTLIPIPPNPSAITVPGGYYTLSATVTPPATFQSSQRTVLIDYLTSPLRVTV